MNSIPKIVLVCGFMALAVLNSVEALLPHFKGVRHTLGADQAAAYTVTPPFAAQSVAVVGENGSEQGRVVVFVMNRYIDRFIRDLAAMNLWIISVTIVFWLVSEKFCRPKKSSAP
jgi:hypothetical protein